MSTFINKLTLLRDEVDDIDAQLVELLAKRRLITAKMGTLKSEAGVPIYAPEREKLLIEKRREQAIKVGISPSLIEDVLRRLMRDSYVSQDDSGYHNTNIATKKVVIIGGAGDLGGVFVDLFKRSNYQVCILEQEDWPNSATLFANADAVIVSVPIRYTSLVIHQLKALPKDCVLADFTSIKESPLYEMLKVHQGPVVGLHPMFGPDVTGLIKQTIIACEGRFPDKCQWLLDQFNVWGAKVYPVGAHEHDQAMSMVQVMRHFSTIVYGYHLMTEGANLEDLVNMSSPIYRLELIMVGRLFAQDPVLYTDIIFANPDNYLMMKRFAHRFLEILEELKMGDKASFITMFKQISEWFGHYAGDFLAESETMLIKANELK